MTIIDKINKVENLINLKREYSKMVRFLKKNPSKRSEFSEFEQRNKWISKLRIKDLNGLIESMKTSHEYQKYIRVDKINDLLED